MSTSPQATIDPKALAQDLNNAREDIQTLQKELQRYRHLEEETRVENKRLAARSEALTKRVEMLEAILEDTKLPQLLSMLEGIDIATTTSVDCLAESLVFRSPEIFEDELMEAKADILPWIGKEFVGALEKQSESSTIKPSSSLVRMVSCVLIARFLCSNQEHTEAVRKRMVLKLLSTMFKVASWSLPTSASRKALERNLELLLAADAALNTPEVMNVPSANKITWIVAPTGSLFDSKTMLAIDSFGNIIQQAADSTEVVGFASVGLQKMVSTGASPSSHTAAADVQAKARTILPAKVFLKSTLWDLFEKEINSELTYVIPDCDGLA